jgi:hypothetical protein
MNGQRSEPEHDAPTVAAHHRRRAALDTLAAQHPDHHIWTETLPGLSLRYIAQRRPGTSAQPYLVVTDDLDELSAALLAPRPGQTHD